MKMERRGFLFLLVALPVAATSIVIPPWRTTIAGEVIEDQVFRNQIIIVKGHWSVLRRCIFNNCQILFREAKNAAMQGCMIINDDGTDLIDIDEGTDYLSIDHCTFDTRTSTPDVEIS